MKFENSCFIVLFVVIIFFGCKNAEPPIIRDFGPTKTKADQGFNVQKDGVSAIWVNADNVTEATVIVWEDRIILSFKQPYGISSLISNELYSKSGQFRIYLLDTKTGNKSNVVIFTVE